MKVILSKTTKIDGKFVMAGEVEVTSEQKKKLDKQGLIGSKSINQSVMTDIEAQKLTSKITTLEAQIKDGGNDETIKTLNGEIETLKTESATKDETIKTLNGEIEALKNNAADLTAPKK